MLIRIGNPNFSIKTKTKVNNRNFRKKLLAKYGLVLAAILLKQELQSEKF